MSEDEPMNEKRVISMQEGVLIGSLFTTKRQCGWKGCDSWRTIALECYEQQADSDDMVAMVYPLCLEHMGQFVDRHILRNTGSVLLAESDYTEFEDEIVPDM